MTYADADSFNMSRKFLVLLLHPWCIAVSGVALGCLIWLSVSLYAAYGASTSALKAGIFHLTPKAENNAIEINIVSANGVLVVGKIGLGLPEAVGDSNCSDPQYECYQWGDYAKVYFKEERDAEGTCASIEWTSTFARELEDCYELQEGVHWYGGGETHTQFWPIEKLSRKKSAFVPGDFLQNNDYYYGGVVEKYWLSSNGAAIVIDADAPLFVSVNTTHPNRICFSAKDRDPYVPREPLTFRYHWCAADDVKVVHQNVMANYFEKPTGIPDEEMLIRPLWSTWAEYKVDVNQSIVLDFARKVVSEGFGNSSHIEIDDNWESCYGQEVFNPDKFPNPRAMVDEIKTMNMRVTAWVHPFVNYECPLFDEGLKKGYFVQNGKPRMGISWWWQGHDAGVIDITNPEAVEWWTGRLRKLQQDTGLDSFKFDAGESNWLPAGAHLNNDTDSNLWPNLYTTKYVETCSTFGGLIETRVAHQNQKLPAFIRMLDKDSRWGYDNGLKSMIPTLLHFSIVGYAFVLPDMIGGNAYNGENPSKELYIRWMQVNIFMPAVQFSLVPWKYDQETIQICLDVLAEREKYRDVIIAAAKQAVQDGSPINRPVWWVDPKDTTTYTIDDEYMLGDEILVAPVVEEGATTRDIYLPIGSWTSSQDGQVHQGPTWLRDYPAPLNVVPYFTRT